MIPAHTPFSIQRAAERGGGDHGWLQTRHSFNFADYYDPRYESWGALRVFNDDVVAPGTGFGTHPHRDMEILTYVLDGELEHKDSMGNVGIVRPGGVQYLSAGTGIAHSEYNHSKTSPVHFVQMWVLPRAAGLQPRYGQVDFKADDRHNRLLAIATGREAVSVPIAIWQDATAYVAHVDSHAPIVTLLAAGRKGFFFVGTGEIDLCGERLEAGDAVRLAGERRLEISGTGEVVYWDIP